MIFTIGRYPEGPSPRCATGANRVLGGFPSSRLTAARLAWAQYDLPVGTW
jgi:hypothetical protein